MSSKSVSVERGGLTLHLKWVALDKHVLMVSARSNLGNHGAYIGAVSGRNHDEEAIAVLANGSYAWSLLAEVCFRPVTGTIVSLFNKEPYHQPDPEPGWRKGGRFPPEVIEVHLVDKHVMAVALRRAPDAWRALIGAVAAENYYSEVRGVVAKGSEIPFDLAYVLFEDLGKQTKVVGKRWVLRDP